MEARSGIPAPGENLSKSPGVSALAQLFYDTIDQGSSKIVISNFDKYITFMSQMAYVFGDNQRPDKTPRNTDDYKDITNISNKKDAILCNGKKDEIRVDEKTKNDVLGYVKKLFETQYFHATECGKIIKLLFNVQGNRASGNFKISLSDNIIKKGFPEIERINNITRELLVNYYTNCEKTYTSGMATILKSV
jgi:hypothetical protein